MRIFDRFPARYLVPNAVTCTSVVFGLWSVRTSLRATSMAEFQTAAWLILYTVLLDKLDGAVARRLKASSEIGVQLDSFSDFVTFGLAPAALITSLLPFALPDPWATSTVYHTALLVLGAAYALAACLRLAKFNVTTTSVNPAFFQGLPSTSSGGLLASAFLAQQELGLAPGVLLGLAVFAAINAFLMVSNLPQPKLKLSKNRFFLAIQLGVLVSVYVLVPLHRWPTYLIALSSGYTVVGFIYGLIVTRGTDPMFRAPTSA